MESSLLLRVPILVTPSGIIILSRELHPEKVCASIAVIFFDKTTFKSDVQPEKANSPISVTLSGMVISLRLVQPEKVLSCIILRLFESFTFESDVQPEKADSPIDVTLSGITISFRLVQPEKAEPLIDVTPSGTVYALRPLPLGYTISSLPSLLNSTPSTLE